MEKELAAYKVEIEKRFQASELRTYSYTFTCAEKKEVSQTRDVLKSIQESVKHSSREKPTSQTRVQSSQARMETVETRIETSEQKIARIIKKAQHVPNRS
jgi:hypothetical protein